MPTYAAPPVTFVRGDGTHLYDDTGKDYLDFLRVSPSRRSATRIRRSTAAIAEQARTLSHVSNLFGNEVGPAVAGNARRTDRRRGTGLLLQLRCRGQRVRHQAGAPRRRPGQARGHQRVRLVPRPHAGDAARHRAAGQAREVPAAARRLRTTPPPSTSTTSSACIDASTAAVLIEVVQGEGGVHPAPEGYVQRPARRCATSAACC